MFGKTKRVWIWADRGTVSVLVLDKRRKNKKHQGYQTDRKLLGNVSGFILNVSVSDLVLRFYTQSCHCLTGFFSLLYYMFIVKVSSWTCYRGCSQQTRGQVCGCRVFYLLLTGFYFTLFRSLCAEVRWQAVQSVCSHAYIHATGAVIKWSSCHMLMSECSNLHHTLDFFNVSQWH